MKKKVCLLFGGKSSENEISVLTAKSIINNIDKSKYDIFNVYIDKEGNWYNCEGVSESNEIINKNEISDINNYIKNVDVCFPLLHGKYGEDGTIQGLFEMFNKKYVGCGVLASSLCMDKAYLKNILDKASINQTKYVYIRENRDEFIYVDEELNEIYSELTNICKLIENKLKYPVFVKPSRSGSSIGINIANNIDELKNNIEIASSFDNRIIIEEGISGRELECAVLGNEELLASSIGEIIPDDKFYSYDDKYKNKEPKIVIPASIDESISKEIKRLAKKAYKAASCEGLSRVDFFLEDKTNKIYLNEINTLPGFTNISMYPKLFEYDGISYSNLIDRLIELAYEKRE